MKRKGRTWLFLLMLALCGATMAERSQQLSQDPLLHDLFLSMAARDRMQQEYTGLVSAGRLNYRENSEFLAYLEQLDLRILNQCLEIAEKRRGTPIEQLPCRAEAAAGRLPARLAAERTPQEELAELDAALMAEMGEFDDKLLQEQKRIAARTARASESAGGGAGGDGGGEGAAGAESGSDFQDGEAEPAGDSPHGEQQADDRRGAGGGVQRERREGGASAPPPDLADGSDDDVVARQLREAAQQEKDPELKRRLWEEYRRYKASTR